MGPAVIKAVIETVRPWRPTLIRLPLSGRSR
jgi:hypothetical protein